MKWRKKRDHTWVRVIGRVWHGTRVGCWSGGVELRAISVDGARIEWAE